MSSIQSSPTIRPVNSNLDYGFEDPNQAAKEYTDCISSLADIGGRFQVRWCDEMKGGDAESVSLRRLELISTGQSGQYSQRGESGEGQSGRISVRHQTSNGHPEQRKAQYKIFGWVDKKSTKPWTSSSTQIPKTSSTTPLTNLPSRSSASVPVSKCSSTPPSEVTFTPTTLFQHHGVMDYTLPWKNNVGEAKKSNYREFLQKQNKANPDSIPIPRLGYSIGWGDWDESAFQGTIGGKLTRTSASPEAQSCLEEEDVTVHISIGFVLGPAENAQNVEDPESEIEVMEALTTCSDTSLWMTRMGETAETAERAYEIEREGESE
ncbi:hypothetical protein BCR39DRAFT_503196 [Naematelia encephala]|uniref:Uncharacterized protein n=1 Tax=Naematelia encephala TaxID=71784 RepID=A0A1Y2BIP5_9TREE|nr:hypothetical protein BCR39DRAFT_503196 [Naematelia encephala]